MATLRKLSRCLWQLYCLTSPVTGALLPAAIGTTRSVSFSAIQTQTVATDAGLTVEEVVRLSHAGFSEELIATKIKKNGKAFDLNTDELVELKKQGISEAIIRVLLDPTQPYTPTPPPAAIPAPAKKYPDDPLASLVPNDTGLYVFSGKTPNKADLKVLLGMRKGKMLKGKPTAYLAGATAKMRVKGGKTVFYLRFPDGKEVSDLILISTTEKEDRRELDGVPGAKGAINADDVLPFDELEVGAKLFRITPPALEAGEYVFFMVGSAELEKGTYGKGYDFGVDSAPGEKKK